MTPITRATDDTDKPHTYDADNTAVTRGPKMAHAPQNRRVFAVCARCLCGRCSHRCSTETAGAAAAGTGSRLLRGLRAVDRRSPGRPHRQPGDLTRPRRLLPGADPGLRPIRPAPQFGRAHQSARTGRG